MQYGRWIGFLVLAICCQCASGQTEYSSGTDLFGTAADGSRFVYVFDKSGSTTGAPLKAAKRELWASLQKLNRVQQFQIIFYDRRSHAMTLAGNARLFWANDESMQLAEAFIRRVEAGGGTNHYDALRKALGLNPDVVFLFTDADEPTLGDDELDRLKRINRSTTIHTFEFGIGPKTSADNNFLSRLAAENGGDYRYVDLETWRPPKRR